MAFSKSPVERVGKSVFTQIGEHLIVDLESREVGFGKNLAANIEIFREIPYASLQLLPQRRPR